MLLLKVIFLLGVFLVFGVSLALLENERRAAPGLLHLHSLSGGDWEFGDLVVSFEAASVEKHQIMECLVPLQPGWAPPSPILSE